MGKRKWKHHFEAGQEAFEAGDLAGAEESLRQALELSAGIRDKDSSYGDTALLLGQVYRRKERYEEAHDMSRKAFSYYESVLGLTDPRSVQAHLAIVLSKPQDGHSDMDVRKATFELAKSQFAETTWQFVRTAALAMPCLSYQEREKVIAQAHSACAGVLNESRVNLALWPPVAEEFADALLEQDMADQAAKFLGFQLRFHEEKLGNKSQEAALVRVRLGEIFLSIGEAKKAETAFGRALEIIKLKVGPKSPEVRRAQVALARALAQQKKLTEAVPYLTEALSFLASHQIEERTDVLLALLEQKCLVAGTDSERGALWQELEAVWERATDDEVKNRILNGLLGAQSRLQQAWELSSADRFLHAVLARVRQWRGTEHHDVAQVLNELCLCAVGLGDMARADGFLQQSIAIDEGAQNLTSIALCYSKMGNSQKAQEYAERAWLEIRSLPAGPDQGRRQAKLAEAMLGAGNLSRADEFAKMAERQVPDSEQPFVLCFLARIQVCQGLYVRALRTFSENVPRLIDPYERAVGFSQYAWLQARTGDFEGAKTSLAEVKSLSDLRSDHPAVIMSKAVASQVAFYSGSVYEGRELRQPVLKYLKNGRHAQATRSLDILVLLEPFGREENQQELDVGTEILAATNFPERQISVFPVIDAASVGLRHVTRALYFCDQGQLAKERLAQYEARFLQFYRPDSPLASSIHLTRATLAHSDSDRLVAMEAALPGLRALSPTHVSLFPTLFKLTEICIRLGDSGRALSHCRAALESKKTPRLVEWEMMLVKGEMPEVSLESSEIPVPKTPPVTAAEVPEVVAEVAPAEEKDSVSDTSAPVSDAQPTRHSGFVSDDDRPTIQDETPTISGLGAPGPVLVASGTQNLADLQAARILSERAEAPTPSEAQDFLREVRARFGQEVEPNLEARVLLALLFPDGSEEATGFWAEAMGYISEAASTDLLTIENRARDASAWSLVTQTLIERLRRETDRFGENAVETLETQMRLARAHEAKGELGAAYRRLTMIAEILRSWFGARSRRLLEPLAELIRVAEKLDDVQAAFEHQLERHRLLEVAEGDAEELYQSRISLLPLRGRLGQINELLQEAHACEQELLGFKSNAASEFVRVLLVASQRVEQLHWRTDAAATLLEIAVRVLPDNEVSLGCRVKIFLAECLYRKDYRSQATRVRNEALEKATSLDADARAEMLHLAAQSCLRIQEISLARSIAERILDERIAQAGRKDVWAGRALLILAEADLRTYRLEGTETAISMSAPSLEGTRYWLKAQGLKIQALYFLNRFDEAYKILDSMPEGKRVDLELQLAVWRGKGAEIVGKFRETNDSPFYSRWERFETLPLNEAVNTLEFFARSGQVKLLTEGFNRIGGRFENVVATDIRDARIKVLLACLEFWNGEWEKAGGTLQRTLELIPEGSIEFPEGLTANLIREALLTCFLEEGRPTSALAQAQQGVAESAELMGEEDVRAQAFRVRLAECARALGQTDDALVLLDEILEPLQELLGDTHVLLRDIYRGLARAFLDQDDAESAQMSAEEALRIDTECRGYSFHVLQDLELLAEITARFDREEAYSVMEQAVKLSLDILPDHHPYAKVLSKKREELADAATQQEAPAPEAAPVSSQDEEEQSADSPETEASEQDETTDSADTLFDSGEQPEDERAEESAEEHDEESREESSEESVEESSEEPAEVLEQAAVDPAEALFEPIGEEETRDEEFELNEDELAELRESGEFEVPSEAVALAEAQSEPAQDLGLDDWVELDESAPQEEEESSAAMEETVEAGAIVVESEAEAEAESESESESESEESSSEQSEAESTVVVEDGEFDDDDAEDSAMDDSEIAVEDGEFDDDDEEEQEFDEADLVVEDGEFDDEEDEQNSQSESEKIAVAIEEVAEESVEEAAEEVAEESVEDAAEEVAEESVEEAAEEVAEESVEEAAEEVAEESVEEAAEEVAEEPVEDAAEEVVEESVEEAAEEIAEEPVEDAAEEVAEESVEEAAEEAEEPDEEAAEEVAEETAAPSEPAAVESSRSNPYRLHARLVEINPVVSSASVEMSSDFPEVPMRLPEIAATPAEEDDAEVEAEIEAETEVDDDGEAAPVADTEAGVDLVSEAEAEPAIEENQESLDESVVQEPDADELQTEDSIDKSIEISVEQVLEVSDPESYLLPLAPLFFLPVPWKEATEAPFEKRFEDVHQRFQDAFADDGDWRSVVEEAVSLVRKEPTPASGYFLFLLGAQLEKGGHLHIADVCLATSLELLESGAPLGAACHLAGRVAGRRGELRRALDYFDRAAELAEEPELAVLKVDAAECQLGLGRPEEALIGFEEVFDYLEENAPKVQTMAVQAKMSQIHLLIGDPDTSLSLAEDTRKSLSPKNVGTYRVLGRILLARAFARLGRHELALELAEKAWEGAESWSAKRKDGRRVAISNLVDIYCVVGRFEDAERLVQESGLTDWGLAEAELLLRAGYVACALGKLHNARRYSRLGKAFLARFQSPAAWQSCFLELESDIYLREGDIRKADALCQAALETFDREATGPVDRSRHLVRAAKIAGAGGNLEEALDLVEQAHSLRDLHLGADHPHTSSVEGLTAVFSGE